MPPQRTGDGVHTLEGVHLALSDVAHRFDTENRQVIDAHWAAVTARKPRLWNGPFFLFSVADYWNGALHGTAHRTDFATFLYWRENGRPADAVHVTGTSLPATADGALLAVRMADHTANSGEVYFPAGSFDEADLKDGMFDVTTNIRRELGEETGLPFDEELADTGLVGVLEHGIHHAARRIRLRLTFDECAQAIADHQATTGDDELAGAVAIRPDDGSIELLKPYARKLAEWHFANS
jgi:8-oxo-dGTP pyrophosphatase MutT (NUDIX family)